LDLQNRSRTKNPTPTPSAFKNPTPPKNFRFIATPTPTPQPCSHMYWGKRCLHSVADQNVHHLEKPFSSKYHAKATWTVGYYLTEVLRWELNNSYTYYLFRDLVDNSALFDVRLIPSRSRQALVTRGEQPKNMKN